MNANHTFPIGMSKETPQQFSIAIRCMSGVEWQWVNTDFQFLVAWIVSGLALAGSSLVVNTPVFAQENSASARTSAGGTTFGNDPGRLGSYVSISEKKTIKRTEEFQIKVQAPNLQIKSSFYHFSRDLRDAFRDLLGLEPEEWIIPIQVQVQGSPTDSESGRYLATQAVLGPTNQFQITVHAKLHNRFDEDDFTREMIRALLLDRMLTPFAQQPGAVANKRVVVPDWMIYGIQQYLEHKRQARPSALFAGYIKSGQLLSVAEIFSRSNVEKLSPIDRAAFTASATALIDALLDQPGGQIGFLGVLGDLPIRGPEKMDLLMKQHFPAFREIENGVEKWWALQVATLGQLQSFEFYDPQKTDQLLTEALLVRFEPGNQPPRKQKNTRRLRLFEKLKFGSIKFDKKKSETQEVIAKPISEETGDQGFEGTVDQFALYRHRPGLKKVLSRNQMNIQHLRQFGFPLYRPLLKRYELALDRIVKNQVKDLEQEFATLSAMREKIRETMSRSRDYLNYFEATASPEKSDAFENYTRLRRVLQKAEYPKRRDRISTYLDDLELEFR